MCVLDSSPGTFPGTQEGFHDLRNFRFRKQGIHKGFVHQRPEPQPLLRNSGMLLGLIVAELCVLFCFSFV